MVGVGEEPVWPDRTTIHHLGQGCQTVCLYTKITNFGICIWEGHRMENAGYCMYGHLVYLSSFSYVAP
jgi:hypothetical protein